MKRCDWCNKWCSEEYLLEYFNFYNHNIEMNIFCCQKERDYCMFNNKELVFLPHNEILLQMR